VGGGTALSAGRCQTPALRLVCEREKGIQEFKSESSWVLSGTFVVKGQITGKNSMWPATMLEELGDSESAVNYMENHHTDASGKVRSALTKPWTESPPQALMTSTLQQQTSNLYNCNPKRTMQIAQKLYEAGHITYMRTDQTNMSEEAILQAKKTIESRWGKQYLGELKPQIKVQNKSAAKATGQPQAQEAHEAIRPTHFENSQLPASEDWSPVDKKIYHLIWLRAIQSIMAQAKGEGRTVIFDLDGDENELPWEAKWKRTLFPGWKIADEKDAQIKAAEDNEDEEVSETADVSWKLAEGIKEGQGITWKTLNAKPKESKPQGRYTEATLVRDLEKRGIGRPSTFASLIATIVEKTYVEIKDIPASVQNSKTYTLNALNQWPPTEEIFQLKKGGEKARLMPTPLGMTILDFTVKNFPDLFAFDFTASMENRLDKVAEGQEPWKRVLEDTWKSYKDRYEGLKGSKSSEGTLVNSRRKEFSDGIVAVMSGKGPLLLKEDPSGVKEKTVFYGWPLGKQLQTITEEEVRLFVENIGKQRAGSELGEYNGHPIVKKKGPYGLYAESNGVRVNCTEETTLEDIIAKLEAKGQETPAKTLGPFQIRTGQYGPYLMKTDTPKGKKPVCVSIPKGTDIDTLTAQQAGEIFEAGMKAKAKGGFRKFKKN